MLNILSIFHQFANQVIHTLWGFGLNDRGQLGDGLNTSLRWPTEISFDIVVVSCGASHTLALTKDGEVVTTLAFSFYAFHNLRPFFGSSVKPRIHYHLQLLTLRFMRI